MPKASVNGANVYYEVVGSGSALVLTTGQGTGHEARQALISQLAERHTVLTYDQRGTGRSDAAEQTCSMDTLAADISALMDVVGFEQADVIGISTGTGKATALAARYPQRVSRLILAAPWTHGDGYLTNLQRLRVAAAHSMPADHYFHFNTLLIYPPEYRREHAQTFDSKAQKSLVKPQDAVGIAGRLESILAFDARELYAQIQCPTLVVGVKDDLVMPFWFAQDAAQAIPSAELALLEHGGHLFAETRPAEFLEHVWPFLNRNKVPV